MKRIFLPTILIIFIIILLFLSFGNLENWFELQLDLQQHNLWIFALVSYLVLSADILLPVPSSIVMFLNGAILGIFWGSLLSLIAAMTSSLIGYFLGAQMSHFADRFFKNEETQTAQNLLKRYGWLAIIATRGLPILAETVALVTGNLRYQFRTFFWSNLVGFIPVCLIYAIAGHYSFETQSLLIAFAINILIASIFWFADRKINIQQTPSA